MSIPMKTVIEQIRKETERLAQAEQAGDHRNLEKHAHTIRAYCELIEGIDDWDKKVSAPVVKETTEVQRATMPTVQSTPRKQEEGSLLDF
ncbi:hypothetical protein JCM19037_1741 [Geomicrobium sp. JCM 19037]|uniref:DUF5327 family protein n=1 Tax=Geomicrobium sp. JCM 19037 TaxID=1460634 RepID=UPI00045F2ED7|nr:DUF5327 family protein [Geomicrobium sp. JCM 19037]GAK03418.1 hypothetical protein JCM19037_1741 [Geomicrobium sp. JCM 19037]